MGVPKRDMDIFVARRNPMRLARWANCGIAVGFGPCPSSFLPSLSSRLPLVSLCPAADTRCPPDFASTSPDSSTHPRGLLGLLSSVSSLGASQPVQQSTEANLFIQVHLCTHHVARFPPRQCRSNTFSTMILRSTLPLRRRSNLRPMAAPFSSSPRSLLRLLRLSRPCLPSPRYNERLARTRLVTKLNQRLGHASTHTTTRQGHHIKAQHTGSITMGTGSRPTTSHLVRAAATIPSTRRAGPRHRAYRMELLLERGRRRIRLKGMEGSYERGRCLMMTRTTNLQARSA